MSVHRLAVRLSREADRDVLGILLYTRRTWGKAQQAVYQAAINQALAMLSKHPQAGTLRVDHFAGRRSFQVEQHVIYFHQPRPDEIEVLRILHSRQDASTAVKEPPRQESGNLLK